PKDAWSFLSPETIAVLSRRSSDDVRVVLSVLRRRRAARAYRRRHGPVEQPASRSAYRRCRFDVSRFSGPQGLSMKIDLNTAATLATLVVITVTAIAAYVQLRHMRTANQLEALLTVLARVEHADF